MFGKYFHLCSLSVVFMLSEKIYINNLNSIQDSIELSSFIVEIWAAVVSHENSGSSSPK